jgi:primosomal protein N' (replication factor Y) (superfamily II helicase)
VEGDSFRLPIEKCSRSFAWLAFKSFHVTIIPMSTFVQIVVNVPAVSGIFDYAVPVSLEGHIGIGHLVVIPFGNKTVQGVVFRFVDRPSVQNVKEILELVDPLPVLTGQQIALAGALAASTLSPLAAILGLFLPVGISQESDTLYQMLDNGRSTIKDSQWSTVQRRLLELLADRGSLRGRQIDSHFRRVEWRTGANMLVRQGVLSAKSVLPPPRVHSKYVRVALLAVTPEQAEKEMPNLGTRQTLERRQAALHYLIRQPEPVNVSWVYAESGSNLADLHELEERGLIRLFESEIFRDPLERPGRHTQEDVYPARQEIELTPEQNSALQQIFDAMNSPDTHRSFLLQGVTGSGKTEVYLRAAEEAIRRGRQAIILVPEIALTPQTVRRFVSRFPGQVGIVHSRLSEGERYDTWRRARTGALNVIIGARSALFSPLPNVGLIVVDESHDASYYQSDPPFYHAVSAAQMYARFAGAVCVLGSATPAVVQRYQSEAGLGERETGALVRLELPRRITGSDLPSVHVVDMREELKAGRRGIFSQSLHQELDATLKRGEQAILFLNRRGTATYIFCRDCGYVLRCPNCDTPLTLHLEEKERLLCHQCGYERKKPATCPQCGSRNIREYGLGSERVEAEVNSLFPKARALRWDWETTRQKDAHEMILTHFANHQADILVGTQMLAKGLDLPLVTLVGIVLADVSLHLPDPFSSERVFQVLTQVAGRAGRSERGGRVILQTFDPGNQVIQSTAGHDVNGFYEYELGQRRRLGYPPFSRLVRLEYRHQDPVIAEQETRKAAARLQPLLSSERGKSITRVGPVPSFFAKVNGMYRWQIILRGSDPVPLLQEQPIGAWFKDWRVEVDPISLL